MQNWGAIMKLCRERSKLTQEKLAEKLHIPRSAVSKIEHNAQVPDMNTLVRWADVTNAREVVVAILYGIDGIGMIQNLMTLVGG